MRIAYINADPGVPVFGNKGASIHVQEVIRAMIKRGAEVTLFAARLGAHQNWPNLRICKLPELARGDIAGREEAALAANEHVAKLMDEYEFDLVYERYSLWSYAAIESARRRHIPALLEVNAPLIEEEAEHRDLINRKGAERVLQRLIEGVTGLVAVSQEVAAYLIQKGAVPQKVKVVANGVDPDRFRPGIEPSVPAADGVFTIGFVGSLKPWHGLSTLIEAFDMFYRRSAREDARPPNAGRLLIVGDGPEKELLRADLKARGLIHATHFTGAVSPDAVPGLLASMDVAVAPYPALQNFYFSPLKVYEYMAAGVSIIASSTGQIRDVLKHGVTGWLAPPGDAKALANALNILQKDKSLRAALGAAAREKAIREHTWDNVVERILDGR